jgi:transcriptional regulator GlxA family with amidase domain
VLDHRRATTHWNNAPKLADRYRNVTVDPNPLFIDEGQVLTSAGVSAGIDLCLYLIHRDLGVAAAHRIARRMVASPQRDGGQAQFIERPAQGEGGELATTRAWMLEQLDQPLSIKEIAAHAHYSERTLHGAFAARPDSHPCAGSTPNASWKRAACSRPPTSRSSRSPTAAASEALRPSEPTFAEA